MLARHRVGRIPSSSLIHRARESIPAPVGMLDDMRTVVVGEPPVPLADWSQRRRARVHASGVLGLSEGDVDAAPDGPS